MLIPVIIVVGIGAVAAIMLTLASKIFYVPVDETFAKLREELPGANCGACGYAGCDDYAKALAEDHSVGCDKCPVGGAAVISALSEIIGAKGTSIEPKVAVVMCDGTSTATRKIMDYQGVKTCFAANHFFSGLSACPYGCMGLGDCARACPYDAIRVIEGVARVDRGACVACGLCTKACPKTLIRVAPKKNTTIVLCKSKHKGADTRRACSRGCIGCKKCETVCRFGAVKVEDNVAFIDPDACKNCGLCVKACPTLAIVNLRMKLPTKAAVVDKNTEEKTAQ